VSKISPIAWMVDIFGPLEGVMDIDDGEDDHYFMEAATASDSNHSSSTKPGSSSKKGRDSKGGKNIWGSKKGPDPRVCIHEDGGRFAIFEKIEITQVRKKHCDWKIFFYLFSFDFVCLLSIYFNLILFLIGNICRFAWSDKGSPVQGSVLCLCSR
jgi:hypothetical protein